MIHALEIAAGSSNQDRAAVVAIPGGLLVVLADGAGGTGNGALAAQTRKPLVGDGCSPLFIPPIRFEGTLVVASDGLFRYAKRADIVSAIGDDLAGSARVLVDLVRLPDRSLQDDVSIVLCSR